MSFNEEITHHSVVVEFSVFTCIAVKLSICLTSFRCCLKYFMFSLCFHKDTRNNNSLLYVNSATWMSRVQSQRHFRVNEMIIVALNIPQALEVMAINHKNDASNKCQHSNTKYCVHSLRNLEPNRNLLREWLGKFGQNF